MRRHVLKTDPGVWEDVFWGKKTFEIRKDDRGFKAGDTLVLVETEFSGAEMQSGKPLNYPGREIEREVTHVLRGPLYGLESGWVIMSLASPSLKDTERMEWLERGMWRKYSASPIGAKSLRDHIDEKMSKGETA